MKVFISWSGETSRQVALALREWLPSVIQAIEPWMSSEDIEKGARWSSSIAKELTNISAGIVCVTPDNSERPWLNFEAGALSKSINQEMVCTYLFRMKTSEVVGPLTEFQASLANREDTRKLVGTLNRALKEKGLPESKLVPAFDRWWPDLEASLEAIPILETESSPKRTLDGMVEEILDIVREQARATRSPSIMNRILDDYLRQVTGSPPNIEILDRLLNYNRTVTPANMYDHLAPIQMPVDDSAIDYDATASDEDDSPSDLKSTILD